MYHEIPVEQLIAVLSRLLPDDVLFPNMVGNLTIVRGGVMIGAISFLSSKRLEDRIEWFDLDTDSADKPM